LDPFSLPSATAAISTSLTFFRGRGVRGLRAGFWSAVSATKRSVLASSSTVNRVPPGGCTARVYCHQGFQGWGESCSRHGAVLALRAGTMSECHRKRFHLLTLYRLDAQRIPDPKKSVRSEVIIVKGSGRVPGMRGPRNRHGKQKILGDRGGVAEGAHRRI